jgi:pimeloyl-ACP methyl ester carboxylesterase
VRSVRGNADAAQLILVPNIRTEEAVMGKSTATIVLVHGAWADGSSWNRVIPLLQTKDLPVIAVQLPLTSLEDDLAATNRIVVDTKGPIVLVGHSWGGIAITQAIGESGSSLIGGHPTPPALSTVVTDSSGFVYQTVEGVLNNIAPDIPAAEARALAVTQGRLAGKAFGQTVTVAAWKTKPSWFIVTTGDRVVSAELQEAEAKRMGARTTKLLSSHMSLLSHPKEVATVIEEAASTIAATAE